MDFQQELDRRREEAEEVIREYLPETDGPLRELFAASDYSMLAGGKRLRPVIMKAVYEAFGGRGKEIRPFMAALEMIHCSSLIHDDLPCMDNDEYRRGKLTTWKMFGYDMAVLSGDDLLVFAFETAAAAFSLTDNAAAAAEALSVLARKAGRCGMIGGQSIDIRLSPSESDMSLISYMYSLKTAALLEAAMMVGAILAGAPQESVGLMRQAALHVGLAFQIRDDILDVTATSEELGKPAGSDEKNNKQTIVALAGLEKAKELTVWHSEEAVRILTSVIPGASFLSELFSWLTGRRK